MAIQNFLRVEACVPEEFLNSWPEKDCSNFSSHALFSSLFYFLNIYSPPPILFPLYYSPLPSLNSRYYIHSSSYVLFIPLLSFL
jgi:hypothetical protein